MRADRSSGRVPDWAIGLILLVVVSAGMVWTFDKELPWRDSHEVRAVFGTAQNIRTSSPVRIAGVDVGVVTEVEHLSGTGAPARLAQAGGRVADALPDAAAERTPPTAALVTMELTDEAPALHTDATFKLLPRLFLEGNLLVDLQPGSPNAPEVGDGHVFGIAQTSVSVQLDQVLSTLTSDVREDLRVTLRELGGALADHGGAEGLREFFRTSPGAFRYSSEVNEALLGTEPGDLSGLVANLDSTVRALGQNEPALKDLVTNLATVTGSLAADTGSLRRAVAELPRVISAGEPALREINDSLPAVRAFAIEALPGVRSTPATLSATTPLLRQIRGLVAPGELRGLVADLRPTIPRLATLTRRSIPFMEESRALSSCFNEVVNPWANDTVEPIDETGGAYPHQPVGRVFEETAFGLAGIGSESRSGDANGEYIRVLAGGGTNTVAVQPGAATEPLYGVTPFPILGAIPRAGRGFSDSHKTDFRPEVPCETQQAPDLGAGIGAPPSPGPAIPASESSSAAAGLPEPTREALAELREVGRLIGRSTALEAEGRQRAARRLQRRAALRYDRLSRDHERAILSGGDG